jgi:glucose/mannose transport system substrate-binding protein
MFRLSDPQKTSAQMKLAADIMDPAFQSAFNVVKGAAPARSDVSDAAFDACGKKAIKDVAEASKNNTLVGSIAHGHAVPASLKNAFYDVITRHFNGQIDDKKAVAEMLSAAKN